MIATHMEVKVQVFDGIGGPSLIIEDVSTNVGRELFRINIPKDIMGAVAMYCARYAYHNRTMAPKEDKFLRELIDYFPPIEDNDYVA